MIHETVLLEDQEAKSTIVLDSAMTAARVANCFRLSDSVFDDLDKISEKGLLPQFIQIEEACRAEGVPMTADLIAAVTMVALHHWSEYGASVLTIADTLDVNRIIGNEDDTKLIADLTTTCEALAAYHFESRPNAADMASRGFQDMAKELAERDWEVALSCALTSANLAGEPTRMLDSVGLITRIATGRDEDWARYAQTMRARATCNLYEESKISKLAAYDAVESACRQAPKSERLAQAAKTILRTLIESYSFLGALAPIWVLAFTKEQDLPPESGLTAKYIEPVWNLDTTQISELLPELGALATSNETHRMGLEEDSTSAVAHADWNTWSFDHEAYRRSIPFSRSILREQNSSNIMLTLNHEITHIYCAFSHLGQALAALRVAALGREIDLWTTIAEVEDTDYWIRMADEHVAPLVEMNRIALALAEQVLELNRKAQVLLSIWLPWLEGVAIFCEMADPLTEPELDTGIIAVLRNITDESVISTSQEKEISTEEAAALLMQIAERRYSEALEEAGRAELRTFLDSPVYSIHYLPGYLAVRAVVSSWRRHVALNGIRASRLLLSVTQGGTGIAVPDLSLPVGEFERQCVELMHRWLLGISRLDESSLSVLNSSSSWRWELVGHDDFVQKVAATDNKPPIEQFISEFKTLVTNARAWRPVASGEGAVPKLTASRISDIRGILESNDTFPDYLVDTWLHSIQPRQWILPLGTVTAPFWLNSDPGYLAVAIRVIEKDHQGVPSYSMLLSPISNEQVLELKREMASRRDARIAVHRFADLLPADYGNDLGRGLGRNVIAFQYGTFFHFMQAGLMLAADLSDDLRIAIIERMAPEPLVEVEQSTADGSQGAARTLAWIANNAEWIANPLQEDILGWPQRVRALAEAVGRDDNAHLFRKSGERILRSLGWSTEKIGALTNGGLRALFEEEFAEVDDLLHAIELTAAEPVGANVSQIETAVRALFFQQTASGSDVKEME